MYVWTGLEKEKNSWIRAGERAKKEIERKSKQRKKHRIDG
jgi:hypothetical protein